MEFVESRLQTGMTSSPAWPGDEREERSDEDGGRARGGWSLRTGGVIHDLPDRGSPQTRELLRRAVEGRFWVSMGCDWV